MRINRYIASRTGQSRRAVDGLIAKGQVMVNGMRPTAGQNVTDSDQITINSRVIPVTYNLQPITLVLNKPVGYVCSRNGQGSRTVYDLLPSELHALKPVGRLDKDSSGLLLMTNDGKLAHELTHPSFQKRKVYEIYLDKDLIPLHHRSISTEGILLEDGRSKLNLARLNSNEREWQVTMNEGRNRQIRRTFSALGYTVRKLHRSNFGDYSLGNLATGKYERVQRNNPS